SDMTIFSLHPAKIIAMGEGGMVTTQDREVYTKLSRLRNHGMVRDADSFAHADDAFDTTGNANPWYYEMPEIGYNYRASDINCALGLSQLEKLERFRKARLALADDYDRLLAPLAPRILPLPRVEGCRPAWHIYVVHIDFAAAGISRAALMNRLHDAGIGSQVLYLPVNRQPYYKSLYGDTRLPGADTYYESTLALPFSVAMSRSDVERVVETLDSILKES
ncbi:MAG: DegT/DnrJ/EryC1/StrS family aminotransferase, partial [Rhodospirillales bacterium]|nr:DegT/DnrJ/EryC1/StrS family aminotransferase [Rhodospirillales bacterium]